jgi:Ca2+-transporting ATPase
MLSIKRSLIQADAAAPRSANERLINTKLFLRSYLFLGGIEAALCMAAYYFLYWMNGWRWGTTLAASGPVYIMATTMCLAGIVASQIGNVFCCRTDRQSIFKVGFFKNKLVLFGIVSEIILILTFVYAPFFQKVFGTAPLAFKDWVFLLTFSPIILLLEEGRKWLIRRRPIKKIDTPITVANI